MHSAGESSAELSAVLAELESLKGTGAPISSELVASLHSRIEQATQHAGATAQQHAIRQADARAASFLHASQEQANDLWNDASERYGHLLSEEEQRAYREATRREQQAIEQGNVLIALDARSDRLSLTRDLYARAGDTDGVERAETLLAQTRAHQQQMLTARGVSAREIEVGANETAPVTAQERQSQLAESDELASLLGNAGLATDAIALDECDPEVTCPPTPSTPSARGRG